MSKYGREVTKLRSDLDEIVAQGDAVIDSMNKSKQAATEEIKQRWNQVTQSVRDRAGPYADRLSDAGRYAYKRGETYVKDYPMRTLAIVAISAFALGALLKRRD